MKGRLSHAEEDYGDYTTRCICSFTHDDGYMICCDECSVWQHVECMEVDPNNLPDKYLCEQCEPRPTDKKRAKMIQTKKREEMTGTDFDEDDSASASTDEGQRSAASSPTPSSSSSSSKRKKKQPKSAGMLRVQELKAEARRGKKEKGLEKEEGKRGSKRLKSKHHRKTPGGVSVGVANTQSPRSPPPSMLSGVQTLLTAASALEQLSPVATSPSPSLWSSKTAPWSDPYTKITSNTYSDSLKNFLSACLQQLKQEAVVYSKEEFQRMLPMLPICHTREVCPSRVGVVVDTNVPEDEMIIEYKGSITTRRALLHDIGINSIKLLWKNKPCPFVYQYDRMSDIHICIDARHSGNMARFIRRSCTPNAELRHFFVNNEVHFGVYALTHLSPEDEVTLPFDFYDKCDYSISCACDHKSECGLLSSPRGGRGGGGRGSHKIINNNNKDEDMEMEGATVTRKSLKGRGHSSIQLIDEDSNSSWTGKRVRQHSQQTSREVTDSDSEDNLETDTPKRRKSREERKTEAVWKMFEKMEATRRKKQQHLPSESSNHDNEEIPTPFIGTPRTRERLSSSGRKVNLLPSSNNKPRLSSISSVDLQSPEPMDAFHSPPLTPSLSTTSLQDLTPSSNPVSSPPWGSLSKLSFEVTPYLHPKYLLAGFALPRKKAILHQWEMDHLDSRITNGFCLSSIKSLEDTNRPRIRGCLKHRWMKRYQEMEDTYQTTTSSFIHHKKKFLHKWEESATYNLRPSSPQEPPPVTMATVPSLPTLTDTNGLHVHVMGGGSLASHTKHETLASELQPLQEDPVDPPPPVPVKEEEDEEDEGVPSSPLFEDLSDDDGFDEEGGASNGGGVVKSLRNLAEESYTSDRPKETLAKDEESEEFFENKKEKRSLSLTPIPSPSPSPPPPPPPPLLADQAETIPTSPNSQYVTTGDKREEEMDISLTPPLVEEGPHPPIEESMDIEYAKHQVQQPEERETVVEEQVIEKEERGEERASESLLKPPAPSKRKMSLLEYRNRSKKPAEQTKRVSYEKPSPLSSFLGTTSSSQSSISVGSVSSPSGRSLLSFSSSFLSGPTTQRQGPSTLGSPHPPPAVSRTATPPPFSDSSHFEPVSPPDEPDPPNKEENIASCRVASVSNVSLLSPTVSSSSSSILSPLGGSPYPPSHHPLPPLPPPSSLQQFVRSPHPPISGSLSPAGPAGPHHHSLDVGQDPRRMSQSSLLHSSPQEILCYPPPPPPPSLPPPSLPPPPPFFSSPISSHPHQIIMTRPPPPPPSGGGGFLARPPPPILLPPQNHTPRHTTNNNNYF